MKISLTPKAEEIVGRVEAGGRTNLVMVLGTGCCDSTAPFLYDNYLPEPDATLVGRIRDIEVLAPGWLAKLYPGNEELLVDVDEGIVNDSFSLESEYDCRFTLRVPARPEEK